jgi:hypothetical protein
LIEILKGYFPFVEKFDDLYLSDVPAGEIINVVYFNSTANEVNKRVHKIYKSKKVLCKSHLKIGGYKFYVNTEYTYLRKAAGTKKPSVVLQDDEGKEVVLDTETFKSKFKLPYARTCHSLQGLTIGNYMNLFNCASCENNPMLSKSWLITALSRCRTLNIRIYSGGDLEQPISLGSIEEKLAKKIENYAEQDRKRGMDPSGNHSGGI